MVSINSIQIDTQDWHLHEENLAQKTWIISPYNDVLSVHYFALRPDLPANLSDLEMHRRATISNLKPLNGELVDIAIDKLANVDALYQILKLPLQGDGRVYLASYTIPFQTFSYVIKVQTREIGIIGFRETFILDEMMNEGKIDMDNTVPDENGRIPEDMQLLISKTVDDAKYDKDFPDHPVSRARSYMQHVRTTIKIDDDVQKSKAFEI